MTTPAEHECERCGGRGWYAEQPHPDYPDDDTQYLERYCDCAAGQRRYKREEPSG